MNFIKFEEQINQNTEIYHKFTTSGSCGDVEGWEDIKTFDECKSSFEALVEQNKRDSSASSVLDQINNIQMVHADLISNWPMGEYANLDDFDTGCVVDVGNNLLYFNLKSEGFCRKYSLEKINYITILLLGLSIF